MFDQLEELVEKFNIINEQISQPEIIADQDRWQRLMKEHSELKDIVEKYQEYKATLEAIDDALAMLEDNLEDDFRELVKEELAENKKRVEPLQMRLSSYFYQKTLMMRKTSLWKFVGVLVEMKPHYLQQNFTVCIVIMQKQIDGKQSLCH